LYNGTFRRHGEHRSDADLSGAGPCTISFRVVRSGRFREDAGFITPCGAIVLDNLAVGGVEISSPISGARRRMGGTMNRHRVLLVENASRSGGCRRLRGGGLDLARNRADQTGGPFNCARVAWRSSRRTAGTTSSWASTAVTTAIRIRES
jgi:hypothetical protein